MAHPAPAMHDRVPGPGSGPDSGPPAATGALKRWGRAALDLVLPPQCMACGAVVDDPGVLCPGCWAKLRFLSPPWCEACGLPFEYDPGKGALCGACARRMPAFSRARAALGYDDASRGLILGFKHGDRTEHTSAFAAWMARAGADLLAEADLIAPVPLHWTRLFARRYNQAALLADALAARCGRPFVPDLVRRRRRTPPLGRLTPAERRRVVGRAFVLGGGKAIGGKRVLLIDDVMTTGETAAACARALRASGACAVDVLTLARVERPLP